jgi:hypothetical protein
MMRSSLLRDLKGNLFLELPRTSLVAQFDPSSQPFGDGIDKGRSTGQLAALHRTG